MDARLKEYTDPFLEYSWFPQSESLYLLHAHEVFYSFVFYQLCYYLIVPRLNSIVFGKHYTKLQDKKVKTDFNIHSISMIQCVVSLTAILPVLTLPINLHILEYHDAYSAMISAITMGYFLWDIYICLINFELYGFQFLIHGAISLYVFTLTLKPFCQSWIGKFLIFEASTPFVNINWYIIQLNKRRTVVPLWFNGANGVLLMLVFFTVRILWGLSAVVMLAHQMWKIRDQLPFWESTSSLFFNAIMDILNIFWFSKMVKIAKKMASKSNHLKQ